MANSPSIFTPGYTLPEAKVEAKKSRRPVLFRAGKGEYRIRCRDAADARAEKNARAVKKRSGDDTAIGVVGSEFLCERRPAVAGEIDAIGVRHDQPIGGFDVREPAGPLMLARGLSQ